MPVNATYASSYCLEHSSCIFRFQGVFEIDKVDIVEVDEGHEGNLFWTALDGKNDYGSLQDGMKIMKQNV